MKLLPLLIVAIAIGVVVGIYAKPIANPTEAPAVALPSAISTETVAMPTTIAPEHLGPVVFRCLPDPPSQEIQATGDVVQACLAPNSGKVVAVPGEVPVLLVQVYPGQGLPQLFIVWQEDNTWRLGEPAVDTWPLGEFRVITADGQTYLGGSSTARGYPVRSAREQTIDGKTYLAALFVDSAFGDQTKMRLVLFALEQRTWRIRWTSVADPSAQFNHLYMQFSGDGIDSVALTFTSWQLTDEKSEIFGESNAGLHRVFHATLERHEDQYALADAAVVASPYNTLVEFVYALRHDDLTTAAARTTDARLIDTASTLGLANFTGAQAISDKGCCGSIIIYPGLPKPVRIDFVSRDGDWYISGFEALDRLPWDR
jgi:hypothetical protein